MKESSIGIKELLEEIGWSKNKFYANIDLFCEIYGLEKEKFTLNKSKTDDYKSGCNPNTFRFEKEWKDILIALLKIYDENPTTRKNATKIKSISQVSEYNKKVLDIIDGIEDRWIEYFIKVHPAYMLTVAEYELAETIENNLAKLIGIIADAPVEVRTLLWMNLGQVIDTFTLDMAVNIKREKKVIDEEKGDEFREVLKGELEHTSIDRLMGQILRDLLDKNYRDKMKCIATLDQRCREQLEEIFQDKIEVQEEVNKKYEALGLDEEKLFYYYIDGIMKENEYNLKQALKKLKQSDAIHKKLQELEHKIKEVKSNIIYYNKVIETVDITQNVNLATATMFRLGQEKEKLRGYKEELQIIQEMDSEEFGKISLESFQEDAKNFKDTILFHTLSRRDY